MAQWLDICLPPVWPRFDSRTWRHMWVEFVVGSRPCSERFFSGYSGFPLSSKTNIPKFQLSKAHFNWSLPLLCVPHHYKVPSLIYFFIIAIFVLGSDINLLF